MFQVLIPVFNVSGADPCVCPGSSTRTVHLAGDLLGANELESADLLQSRTHREGINTRAFCAPSAAPFREYL